MDNQREENLAKSAEVSPWKLLLLEAEDALLTNNTRLAVILGQTAIEGAVEELLTYNFHEKRPSMQDVRDHLFGRQDKKAKVLSYESAVQEANIHNKLSMGLRLATGTDLSTNRMLSYEWQVANAARIACVHHGYAPSRSKARTVINTYWQIYQQYLDKPFLGRDATPADIVSDSIEKLNIALGQAPSESLSNLVQSVLPKLKRRVVVYHLDLYPVRDDKLGSDIIVEECQDIITFWLDPKGNFDMNQMLIAGALMHFKLLFDKYPYARVSDALPPGISRIGWEAISETLTKTVLQLSGDDDLRAAGFPVDNLAKVSLASMKKQLLSPDWQAPNSQDTIMIKTFPLNVIALYFNLKEDCLKQELLALVRKRAPTCIKDVELLLEAVKRIGYETREKCTQLMVACRNYLRMYDSCLIVDPKRRRIYYSSVAKTY